MSTVDCRKTITALAHCTYDPDECPRSECPYWDEEHCEFALMTDALALIKELMPRVLTLAEAHRMDECWFEWKDGSYGYAEILWEGGMMGIVRVHSHGQAPVSLYGKNWRCWSHRPTDEQRKAEKWDAM